MFCSSCGKDLIENAKFCAHCGVHISTPLQVIQEAETKTSIFKSAGQAIIRATSSAGNMAGVIATQIGDLNGDGKVDEEDLKIATARAKGFASDAAVGAAKMGKEALKSDMAKDAAAGAAVGAAVAIPIPLIGPAAGAVVGAGLGIYKNITKK
jgi:hypothetical protein